MSEHGNTIPEQCLLAMPNFQKTEVAIAKRPGGWYFGEGWSEFVYNNHVSNGEWLTFTYTGDGLFYVKRFLFTSGCPPRSDLESKC